MKHTTWHRRAAAGAFLALLLCPVTGYAIQLSGYPLMRAPVNLNNRASLQRGARTFVNYCMGCHTLQYLRWSRLGRDLRLNKRALRELMFLQTKPTQMMLNAMPAREATRWFGAAPPDLSVMVDQKGVNWVYTYLQSFYLDPNRPTGVNNAAFYRVAMPDPFWQVQGLQKLVFRKTRENGGTVNRFVRFVLVTPGTRSPASFRRMVGNLTNFLYYAGHPDELKRVHLGIWVIAFLVAFTVFAYLLKREYWKDVHRKHPHEK
jgi:ubiquinol-cytochrome c reductase cytochrome c1 subunit